MRVREVMTEDVLTIGPEAPLKDVAKVMVANGISGLPVCDIEGHVVGVISEGDILYKEHDPTERRLGGPLGWLVDGSPDDKDATAKAQAVTAGTAMTSPAVTIPPYESVSQAARVMCERKVNRLPVVKAGKLVGILTRADLVRAFTRTDAEIEQELREDVLARTMWIEPGRVDVAVRNGVVTLTGGLRVRADVELLERLASRVPGVISVESDVRWEIDDTTRKGRRAIEHQVR
jgi:CBS domain-containing protein